MTLLRLDHVQLAIPVHMGNTVPWFRCLKITAVYPRTYGEHCIKIPKQPRRCGLSPYLRGTQFTRNDRVLYSRFIPVPTGNTWTPNRNRFIDPVYPRTHGEHLTVEQPTYQISWFIPVPTGNTNASVNCRITHTVYPRTHGEHNLVLILLKVSDGLSPYSRGTRAVEEQRI